MTVKTHYSDDDKGVRFLSNVDIYFTVNELKTLVEMKTSRQVVRLEETPNATTVIIHVR